MTNARFTRGLWATDDWGPLGLVVLAVRLWIAMAGAELRRVRRVVRRANTESEDFKWRK